MGAPFYLRPLGEKPQTATLRVTRLDGVVDVYCGVLREDVEDLEALIAPTARKWELEYDR